MKVVQLTGMTHHRRELLENEVRILKMVNHEHILAFLDIYHTANNYYIITEYCEGGSLFAQMEEKKPF
jgi:serine/threonine protein kinase